MVCHEEAVNGWTHGIPGLKAVGYDLKPSSNDPAWIQARVSTEWLIELVRTPGYITWQGEQWQFCCGRPMVFVGEWKQKEVLQHVQRGDAEAWLASVMGKSWNISLAELEGIGGPYMFHCVNCGKFRGHWDCD
jgi:uncharacterized protein CbrC (UPF0167 family)